MFKINKKITLDNGIEINTILLSKVSYTSAGYNITLSGYCTEEVAQKSIERVEKLSEQQAKIQEFDTIQDVFIVSPTDEMRDKLKELQQEINQLADELDLIPPETELLAYEFKTSVGPEAQLQDIVTLLEEELFSGGKVQII